MISGRLKTHLNSRWLSISVSNVNDGVTTITKECLTAQVIVDDSYCIRRPIDRGTYLRRVKELGLEIVPKKGKQTSSNFDNLKKIILDYRLNCTTVPIF